MSPLIDENAVKLARRTRKAYNRLIAPLREIAQANGYALAVHGSLARDIDLIAAPWTDGAVEAHVLAEAIGRKAAEIIGYAWINPRESDDYFLAGCPGGKPHQRRCWSFHLGIGSYIDLSVMPLVPDTEVNLATMGKIANQSWQNGC